MVAFFDHMVDRAGKDTRKLGYLRAQQIMVVPIKLGLEAMGTDEFNLCCTSVFDFSGNEAKKKQP